MVPPIIESIHNVVFENRNYKVTIEGPGVPGGDGPGGDAVSDPNGDSPKNYPFPMVMRQQVPSSDGDAAAGVPYVPPAAAALAYQEPPPPPPA